MSEESESISKNCKYDDIYERLASKRVIFLAEELTKENAGLFSSLLLYYDDQSSSEDITIYINSNGGDACALSNMHDIMQMIKAPIQTVCIGKAYSGAAILLASGTRGKRFATKHSDIMIHGIQAHFPLSENADKTDIELDFKILKVHNDILMKVLARHTKKSISTVTQDCSRDLYLEPKHALEYGIIDHIL